MSIIAYTPTNSDFPNPGRGFWGYSETHTGSYSSLDATALATARVNQNQTLIFRYFVMEKYLSQDALDQTWLDAVDRDFAAARTAGVKIVARFCYSTSGQMNAPYQDAPAIARITAHQNSLAVVLNKNRDVLAYLQCGLIGMWGEWYYTDLYGDQGNVNDAQWIDRVKVVKTWLTLLDPTISILVRYAGIKLKMFGQSSTDPLAARVGFHNDAFLAPWADYGTYSTFTSLSEAAVRAYVASETKSVPMCGESAVVSTPDTLGPNAIKQASMNHWDGLNSQYHPDVLSSWSTDERATITRNLGYRLALTSASIPTPLPGAKATMTVTLTNLGYAAARHDKTLYVTIDSTRYLLVGPSIRSIQPGSSVVYTGVITAPAAGNHDVFIELVDPQLSARGEYAIRLANTEIMYSGTKNRIAALTVTATPVTPDPTPVTSDADIAFWAAAKKWAASHNLT